MVQGTGSVQSVDERTDTTTECSGDVASTAPTAAGEKKQSLEDDEDAKRQVRSLFATERLVKNIRRSYTRQQVRLHPNNTIA